MNSKKHKAEILLHILVWGVIFLSPIASISSNDKLNVSHLIGDYTLPVFMFVLFYLNYLWLAPTYLLNKRNNKFILINLAVIFAMGIAAHQWMMFCHDHFASKEELIHERKIRHEGDSPSMMFFLVRNMITLSFATATASAIILSRRWTSAEKAREEAEAAKIEAELKNLRSQVNPHFLLNTLNNIYALTTFDLQKAQDAILQLSKMLRHILYDNQQPYVNLESEAQFLGSYISLMKIRVSKDVEVTQDIHIPHPCNDMIAPLIFISLIENAFKHGISPTEKSFIHISLHANGETIICEIENSNHPKTKEDHSGHGIGLEQVQRRLDISYPGKYEWIKGLSTDGNIYKSKITIYDTQLRNH
jgi:two-component sensor histidine kinase